MMRCAIEISIHGPILGCQHDDCCAKNNESRLADGKFGINSSSLTIAGSSDVDLEY